MNRRIHREARRFPGFPRGSFTIMKIPAPVLLSSIAAFFLASPAFAQTTAIVGFPVHAVSATNTTVPIVGSTVSLGDCRKSVIKKLGLPMTYLSADSWLYENVEVSRPGENEPASRNILIVFSDDKLTTLAIVTDGKRSRLIAEAAKESSAKKISGVQSAK